MHWKDTAYLMKEEKTLDELHRPKVSYIEQKIFCNVKSVGFSEFYQAQSAGFKPEIKIETKLIDLTNVTHVKLNNTMYKVLRIYKKQDITEIILTSMVIANE